jgi:hypothetical protein
LGRGYNLGKSKAKIAKLGSKKARVYSDFRETA